METINVAPQEVVPGGPALAERLTPAAGPVDAGESNGHHLRPVTTVDADGGAPAADEPQPYAAMDVATREPEEAAHAQIRALIERTKRARPTSDADLLMRAYAFAG